jgi:AraC-like DNA-binding protein
MPGFPWASIFQMGSESQALRRTRMLVHESALGDWKLLLLDVHEALRGIVSHLWYGKGKVAYARDRILPRASSLLLINVGPPQYMVLHGPPEKRLPFSDIWFSGIGDTPIDTEAPLGSAVLGVSFTAVGAATMLHVPPRLTANQTGSFESLIGKEARSLHQRLLDIPDALGRLVCLEDFLLRRCSSGIVIHPLVNWAAQLLAASGGRIGTRQLVRESGYSRKQLALLFKEQVGLAPKTLARIHRFQGALRMITAGGRRDWCGVALDTGYYDQAHMINEFRDLAGLTPREISCMAQPDTNSVVLW